MATAFYLGMKSAQLDVNLDFLKSIFQFVGEINKEKKVPNIDILLKYEFYMIHILNYDFYVFCPYKAMCGLFYKLKSSALIMDKIKLIENLTVKDIENEAEKLIDRTFATDSIFIYNYSYNALACILLAFRKFKETVNLDISYNDVITQLGLEKMIDCQEFLNATINKINDFITKIPTFSRQDIIEKKSRTTGFLLKYKEYNEKLEKDRQ